MYLVGVKYLTKPGGIMADHHGFFEENYSPEECLERIQSLFNDENTNTESLFDLQYLDQLLTKLHIQSPESHLINKRVASFVRDVATFYPDAVCHLLLIHLPHLSDPIPFVDIMASLFCFALPSLVVEAFKQLKILSERDNRLLLPVIGAMADLPLPDNLLQELCILAEDAIQVLDEIELPALFRTLIRSLCPSKAERAILKLRDEMTNISDSSIALLVEVMWEILPSSSGAAEVLLDQIFREQEFQSLRQPPLTDLAVVLILTSNIGALKFRARALFDLWLKQGTFPFAQLELVLSLRRSNEIWERMIPAIWRLCLWTLETLADTDTMGQCRGSSVSQGRSGGDSGTISSGVKNHVYLINKEGLSRTVHRLCACMPSVRETIVSSLLSQCYTDEKRISTSSNGKMNNTSAREDRDGSWLMHLQPLGEACEVHGIISLSDPVRESSSRDQCELFGEKNKGISPSKHKWNLGPGSEKHLNRKAQAASVLAATLLESLAGCNAEIGASVLSSIMDRLTPSSSSQGGTLLLPPAAVLHCLMGCIVSVTGTSPQIENTVFIVIQKLLASSVKEAGEEDNLMRILSSTSSSSSLSATIGAASSKIASKLLDGLSPTCLQIKYSPGTVGCFLSGHLLLRETPHPLNATDFRAVLAWLTRAVPRFSDLSIACALDVLVACIRRRETNNKGSGVRIRGSVSVRDEEQGEQMGLLKAAADLCLQRIFKLKALVLSEEILSKECFIASVTTDGDGFNTIRYPVQGEGEGVVGVTLHWNVAALSANLVLSEVSGERHRFNESHRAVDRSDSITAVCSAAFWVLQRAAALHSTLSKAHDYHIDSSVSGSRSDNLNVMSCIGIVMSRSELDTPERESWMNSNNTTGQHHQVGKMPAPSVSTTTPKNKGRVTRRSAEIDIEETATLSDVNPGFSVWACSAVDGIESLSFTRSLSLSPLGALRLAWERAMCAAVLLEHSPVCDSLHGPKDDALKALLSLSRLLCQMHMSRYMLRGTMAGSLLLTPGRGGNASIGRHSNARADRLHSSHHGTVGDAGDYTSESNFKKSMKKAEATTSFHADDLVTQRVVVQNLLSRVEGLIRDETVLLSMRLLLADDTTTCIPPIPTNMPSTADAPSSSRPHSRTNIPSALLTDAGLAVVSCFAVRLLTGQLQSGPPNDADRGRISSTSSSSILRRPDELFYSLLEVTAHTADVHSSNTQSTSSSSTNSATSDHRDASHITEQSNIISSAAGDLLCFFISLAPLLSREEDSLRKASILPDSLLTIERNLTRSTELKRKKSENASSVERIAAEQVRTTQSDYCSSSSSSSSRERTTKSCVETRSNVVLHSVMGAVLDRAGCAVLLMTSYVLLDFSVNEVRRRVGGDIDEVAADPFLVNVAQAMLANSRQDTLDPECESHSSSDEVEEECQTMSVMRMYDITEKQVLATQDVTLALGGLRLLSSLSAGSMLCRRQASVAWALLRTLHTQHTNLSTDLLSSLSGVEGAGERGDGIPGTDDLWEHLASFICPSRNPSIDYSISELQGDGSTGFFATIGDTALLAAISAFRNGLGLPSLSSSARGQDASLTANGISSFRIIWTFWWGSEEPEARVHGVVALLADIFKYHLLPSDAESATQNEGKRRGSASKERKVSGVSQVGSAGAMAWLSYNSSSTDASAFHALTHDNFDALFTLAVSTFPALFLLAKPQPCNGSDAHEGPYRSLTAVVKAFVWLLEQLEVALEDGSQLFFLRCHSVFCVRMTRAVIACVEGMLVGVVAWRSEQALPPNKNIRENSSDSAQASTARPDEPPLRPSLSHSDCSDKGTDDGENEDKDCGPLKEVDLGPVESRGGGERDSGSVEHLADLLDWSQALAQRVIRYAETLKDRMLLVSSGIKVSGNLSRAVPQLQFAAERLAAKVLRTAKAHSVLLKKAENMFADRGSASMKVLDSQGTDELNIKRKKRIREDVVIKWSDDVMQRAVAFTAAHRRQLLHPADDSLWCSVLSSDPNSLRRDSVRQRCSLDSSARRDDASSEDSDDESASVESEEGRFVARARKGSTSPGWGLYRYQEDDNEEEENEEDDDDKTVIEPIGQGGLGSQPHSSASNQKSALLHEQLDVEIGSPNLSLHNSHTPSEVIPGLSPQDRHTASAVAKSAVEKCVPQSVRKRSKAAMGDSMLAASTPVSALKALSRYT